LIIKPAQSTIYLSGGVINEAVYEFKEGEYLSDIINFAGGFISSFNNIIRIDRTTKDGVQSLEVPLKSITETQLSNFDNIMVQSYAPVRESIQSVKLTGEVMNPGDYNIKTGETLSQLINRAGGYTDNAQEYRGVFNRAEAYEVSKTSNQRNYSQMIKFIATSPAARDMIAAGETSLAFILQEYRNLEPSGRIIAEFDLSKIRNDPSLDITLVASDEIHIPKITQMVYITGELLSPSALPYKPEYNFKDYIEVTGGYSEFSDNQRVIVIHPNGSARLVRNKLFNFESRDSILPGSVIYVPREIGKIEGLNYAAVLAPVFSSLALSVASLNAID
jgi:polysaccharide export outer membrane protein